MEKTKMHTFKTFFALFALSALIALTPTARAAVQDFNGRWDLQVQAKPGDFAQFTTTAAWWLDITGAGTPQMKIQFIGAPDGALDDITEAKFQDGVLHFTWVAKRGNDRAEYVVKCVNGLLQGATTSPGISLKFIGHRAPETSERDDGTWVRGKPIKLFNGKNLEGWTGVNSPKAQGWSVKDGLLKCTGNADDLITVENYWNFELHVEYNLAEKSNSGIGLRGRYEVQIMSDYGRPPNLHSTGSLVSRIAPVVNAGKPAGEWNRYDIRLVGREVTTTLNGQRLYEKGVIDGLTGIAFDPFEGKPGPVELQGDHGAVEYRNIVLTPLTQRKVKSAKPKGA